MLQTTRLQHRSKRATIGGDRMIVKARPPARPCQQVCRREQDDCESPPARPALPAGVPQGAVGVCQTALPA